MSRPTPAVGSEMTAMTRRVTQEQIAAYAEASGDRNPIHLDPEFARRVGLAGTIAHGMLEMAVLAEAVSRWAGGYDRLLELRCRFSKPLFPGDEITCTGRVVAVGAPPGTATLEVQATSGRGDRVLSGGRAVVRVQT